MLFFSFKFFFFCGCSPPLSIISSFFLLSLSPVALDVATDLRSRVTMKSKNFAQYFESLLRHGSSKCVILLHPTRYDFDLVFGTITILTSSFLDTSRFSLVVVVVVGRWW